MLSTNPARSEDFQKTAPSPTKPVPTWLEFAGHLVRRRSITGDVLSKFNAEETARQTKKLRDLWELTDLSSAAFAEEVAQFYDLPRLDLAQLLAASSLPQQFSRRFLRDMAVFPCHTEAFGKTVVMADPSDAASLHAVELVLGEPASVAVASFEDIATVLSEQSDALSEPLGESAVERSDNNIETLRDLASGAPVVRAVNELLEKAVELRATDIHIEPFRGGLIIRMRVDGLLRVMPTPANALPQALVSRLKILAGLNIAERRLPQDGAAHLRIIRSDVDIRVATMPTHHGEAAVIRLLPKDRGALDVPRLGLQSSDQAKLKRLLDLPHGMIVVTGPTGSGKTTTLATMLTVLNDTTRKILTVEDPVEYEIRGINQSQVKPEIGLTFANALRAFVRQDPDVIMVGEVRDGETAHIAVHAALTGHLVLTTLHTETAAAAVPRLLDLGVEGFLLQSTLRAVVAQRLVRILCERCKVERRLTQRSISVDPRYAMLGLSADDAVYEADGCERCSNTGYRGRTGLFEILEIDDDVRSLIGSKADAAKISRAATRAGMTSMFEDGIAKCRVGTTSAAEVFRVTTAR